jgi:hypothetical protein
MPTRSGEVDPSFSIRSRGGPSVESPVLVHYWDGGPPWAEPMMMASKPSPVGGEAQATEMVGDELKTPKVNGFI